MLRPLHSKGIVTVSLLILAESISFTNAVASWADVQRKVNPREQGDGTGSGFATPPGRGKADTASCPATAADASAAPQAPVLRRLLNRRSAPGRCPSECCAAQCASRVVPRGGHTAPLSDSSAAASSISVSTATPYGIPLHLWKVIFQALLTAINVACWLIPLKSKKISDNKLGLSLANAFSGGVFLSLAFGHLIPECVGGFAETAGGSASLSRLPAETPYLLVLGGYLLIFFVEKVAFDAHEILHEMEEGGGGGATAAGHGHQHPPSPRMANGGAVAAKRGIVSHVDSPARSVSSSGDTAAQSSGRSAVILLGALAVHSVLEMTALGLSNSFGDCALLTLSIALHQPAESIALLVAFLKSGMPRSQIVQYLSIFSCMGPIGVGLGMAVNEYASPVVDSVMLAVVAGTFVYVGATEVIPEEWEDSAHKWPKFVALMSGIACIVTITQYTMSLH